ncbi:MAG: hypothetical protein JRI23_25765 [Deltaproteobacteria bacterium]|jgi:hypothetical protein|nr:hypothetical protein [Deltaproteobacteria bacterium]MBW2535435.1 hypothetical protein [Deltaproteobacteria bacterium]
MDSKLATPLLALFVASAVGCSADLGSQEQDDTEWIGSNSVEVNARIKSTLVHAATGAYAELATDAELQSELIGRHVTYAKNPLEKSRYYLNMEPDEVLSVEVKVDGELVELTYEASIDMVYPSSNADAVEDLSVAHVDAKLPSDPVDVFARGGTACASDYGSYILNESKYFYYFDAHKDGCPVEMVDATIDVVSVYPNPTVYPEYDRLMNDMGDGTQGFRAAILPNRGDDDPMDRYNNHRRELNRALGMEPVAEDGFERYRWTKDGVTIVVDLFDPTDVWFTGDFHAALADYQLVFYNGHSNYGNQPYLDRPEVYSDEYQIIGMHSCKSYSYYAHQVATGKATAEDPTGWRNADMIATGRSSYPGDSPYVLAALLDGLMNGLRAVVAGTPTEAPSWQEIGEDMRDVAPYILYGVAGARHNAWKPTTEPTRTECNHGLCVEGPSLDPSCDPCAAQIIAADPYCRDTSWDELCVEQVQSVCQQTCP